MVVLLAGREYFQPVCARIVFFVLFSRPCIVAFQAAVVLELDLIGLNECAGIGLK